MSDYDDWITDTHDQTNRDTHGLNGDILVWNQVTQRRHELFVSHWDCDASPWKRELLNRDTGQNL
jgi:asparagine synthetase A